MINIDAAAQTVRNVAVYTSINFVATDGITTNNGNLSLNSADAVQVNQAINAGTGIVRIQAAGDVTQSATISAQALGVATKTGRDRQSVGKGKGAVPAGGRIIKEKRTFNAAT